MLEKLFGTPSSPLAQAQAANQTLNAAYAKLGARMGTWLDSYDDNVPDDEAMVWRSLKTGPLHTTGTLTLHHLQRCLLS